MPCDGTMAHELDKEEGCCSRSYLEEMAHTDTVSIERRRRISQASSRWNSSLLGLTFLTLFVAHAQAAFVEFSSCLTGNRTDPNILHFIPHYVDVAFDTQQPSHMLNITVFGNVTGQDFDGPLPPADSPLWNDPGYVDGKLLDIGRSGQGAPGRSALQQDLHVLSYTPATFNATQFCQSTTDGTTCPVAPVFNVDANVPSNFRSFGVQRELNSSYRFATIDTTLRATDANNIAGFSPYTACVNIKITPSLQTEIFNLVRFLPLAVLVFVAMGTVSAAILSPWGTSDPFKWTSNYGRDEDLLRLVTPGFGDCLQYIQFIYLSGTLSLNYPGFFRPVVSAVNWSALQFNDSFVDHGTSVQNPVDGIYVTHADYSSPDLWDGQNARHDYGMSRMRQLIGLAADEDVWADTVIWLLVIIAGVIVLCQLFFIVRWIVHTVTNEPEEDLRNKNWPFTGGMLVRLVCFYFLLPLAAVSFFQLVVAGDSLAVVTVFAVILLVLILAFAGWILHIIFAAKPRSILFDDLQTVLLYGPLYNTYSDDAAPFALVPAMLTFIRGIAFGAVQPSGIAQIVILAVCEVSYILTLHAFRPFRKQTSMNAYHTLFAVTRLVTILLSIAFVPEVSVEESTRGWIGYVILFLHALVLVFGFFLNAIQTLIEVIARYMGAGADETTGAATRGTFVKVFGKRQLTRRRRRPARSLTSEAMLTDDADAMENKSAAYGSRSRSMSASSAILLNQRTSSHLDRAESGSAGRETSAANSTYAALQDAEAGPSTVIRAEQGQAPFYRAPRQRRPTGDLMPPGQRSRASWLGGGGDTSPTAGNTSPDYDKRESSGTIGKAISTSPEAKAAPSPAYMRKREGSDPTMLNDPRRTDVDYAVREVDFYYNVRGPRLNDQPTRQLKTGPADPVGPVSSATGWFKTMFGRKSKDQSKGFEVVRSTRAPPEGMELGASPELEPYQDSPVTAAPVEPAVLPGQRTRSSLTEEDREQTLSGAEEEPRELDAAGQAPISPVNSTFNQDEGDVFNGRPSGVSALSDLAPSLEPIDAGSSIHMPSRFNSAATAATNRGGPLPVIAGPAPPLDNQPPMLAPIDSGSSIHMPSRFNSTATTGTMQRQTSSAEQYGHLQPRQVQRGPSQRSIMDERDFATRPVTPPGRMPFSTPLSPIAASGRTSIGADSALSIEPDFNEGDDDAVVRNVSGNLAIPTTISGREDRPSSTGQVQHYRIADRITQGTPDIEFREGHAAEVVDASRRSHSARSSEGVDRIL